MIEFIKKHEQLIVKLKDALFPVFAISFGIILGMFLLSSMMLISGRYFFPITLEEGDFTLMLNFLGWFTFISCACWGTCRFLLDCIPEPPVFTDEVDENLLGYLNSTSNNYLEEEF